MLGGWEHILSPSGAVGVGRQGKRCQEELVPGRGDVKQLLAQVLIQAGNCREQHRHFGTQGAVGGTGSVQHRGDCQEEHGQCGTEGTVRSNTVRVADRDCQMERGQFGTEGLLGGTQTRSCYWCFSIPQNSVYWDGVILLSFPFGKVRRTLSGSS